jgi:hypothetical protein
MLRSVVRPSLASGLSYGYDARVVRVKNVPARAVYVLQGVHDPALVVSSLEDVAVARAGLLLHRARLLLDLVPGRRRRGDAGLLQEIASIVQEPRVRAPGDTKDASLVDVRLQRRLEKPLLLLLGEAVGEVEDKACSANWAGQVTSPSNTLIFVEPP